ncbi:ComF family protein [Luminiphilus syltensis NOR5-1B]|uniref:ComF family protein n=1 Tax=Luminiphilus syltensis NOR5-1B TaxID=565045 RepID=B8KUV0_9GAMM|nr:phosphoribosyltransferase family protein [Luminiphilus syltensis]EED34514.1 ComF family protein [Luminiphilus syltensis NOR5-1B]
MQRSSLDALPSTAKKLRQLIGQALPPICILCDQRHDEFTLVCQQCANGIQTNDNPCPGCAEPGVGAVHCGRCQTSPRSFDRATAPLLFEGPVRELVHRWKFNNAQELSALLANLLASHLPPPNPKAVYVPIPLHWRRRWFRGFDQVWQLTNALAQQQTRTYGDAPAVLPLLRRVRHTPHQSGAKLSNRESNVKNAFTLSGSPPKTAEIILVDDVLTTGATANAAARLLKASGVAQVELLCLGRAARH